MRYQVYAAPLNKLWAFIDDRKIKCLQKVTSDHGK